MQSLRDRSGKVNGCELVIFVVLGGLVIWSNLTDPPRDREYKLYCPYCAGDSYVDKEDVEHAKRAGYPEAASWRTGPCPKCTRLRSTTASGAGSQSAVTPAVGAPYSTRSPYAVPSTASPAVPLPAPEVQIANDIAPAFGAPGLVDGFVRNRSNRILRSATIVVQSCTDTGLQLESYTLFVSYVDPGGSAYWKTPLRESGSAKTIVRITNYRYGD